MLAEYWERRKFRAALRAKGVADSDEAEMPEAKYPVGVIADLTAPALIFAQVIGRLGDIVNGEHCAKATDLFFGFRWIDPTTAARSCVDGFSTSVQPVVAYEMIWNMMALAILWQLRGRLKPNGMLFAVYLALYSVGRLSIDFLRLDPHMALSMQGSQFIALAMLAISVPLLLIKARPAARAEEAPMKFERGSRADIRRRRRSGR
jgi:phosphatidylglycerol:prolipoprotein diacylglycerol transferase